MTHRFFEGLSAPLHISHRGGALLYPENTMGAFRAALEVHRTDMLELDLHLTRDGELVVFHDDLVDRVTDGHGDVHRFSFAELQKLDAGFRFSPDGVSHPFRGKGVQVPRFVDVLRAFPGVRVNVELKTDDTLDAFVALVRAEKAELRLCAGSERDDLAAKISEQLPEMCLFFPRDTLVQFVLPVLSGEPAVDDPRYSVLDMPLSYEGVPVFTDALVAECKRLGKWINVWTIDDEPTMRQVIAMGVGGVMTDRPDVLRKVLS